MDKPKNISNKPGIYIFKNFRQKPLYVGKAGNLKKRLAFYFSKTKKTPKLSKLMTEAKKLQIIETDFEVEALIKESELIKKYLPKYNVLMRDDKNYFYVGFTNERFPRIFITHQPFASSQSQNSKRKMQNDNLKSKINYVGPFTDGTALKTTLQLLRRIFPYCTCKELHKRPCLNSEIGRCPGFCCYDSKSKFQNTNHKFQTNSKSKIFILSRIEGQSSKQRLYYQSNIQNITTILQGKKTWLIRELKKKIVMVSKKQEFEKAARLRDQIRGLENIFEHRQLLEVRLSPGNPTSQNLESALQKLLQTTRTISRIEGYDISNIFGTEATGSMVVFIKQKNGFTPDKSQYRKFKIKTVHQISDVDMMAEVARRRFNHSEWQFPDLIIIDGGKPQLNAVLAVQPTTSNLQPTAIITALAKREEELYIKDRRFPIKLKKQPKEILHLFQRVRDESHRFAKRYHHERRKLFFRKK